MQKRVRFKQLIATIIMAFTIMVPTFVYGSSVVPDTIRVGLRKNYSNASEVVIKDQGLNVGYERNNRFVPETKLQSKVGFIIKPSFHQYYERSEVFSTYQEAVNSLLDNIESDPVVAYIGPNTWKIYTKRPLAKGQMVQQSGDVIVVEDTRGSALLVCNNTGSMTAFAGDHSPFYLTELIGGIYRGWFEFIRQGSKIMPVNIVDYEDYLYGVIAAEMPASWHMEALKAQAVAARSMSIHQYNKYIKNGYNVCDTTFTQVYRGYNGEHVRTNQAVDETKGMIAMYGGKVAETLYYSTSGGYTEDPKYVWGNPVAYLQALPDPYEKEPEMKPWTRTITLSDLDLCLARQNINIGKARGFRINAYTPAGRVNDLEIIGTAGTHKLIRENIRTFFTYTQEGSLRSRMFTINGGKKPLAVATLSESSGPIMVYGTSQSPQYIIDASGKTYEASRALVVQGSSRAISYGTGGNKQPSSTTQEQYGDIVLSGQGYGHGVGMSQSGARGMAQEGYAYDEIIKYYYPGVTVQ